MTALMTISCDRSGCEAEETFETEDAYSSGWRGCRYVDFKEPYVTKWLCPDHAKDLWK